MNSATTQPLLHDSPEGCHGAEAGSHRPRPTTDPFFFVWRDSDFFFRYGGGEARSGFSKGETGGIQMRTPLAEYGDNPERKNTPCISDSVESPTGCFGGGEISFEKGKSVFSLVFRHLPEALVLPSEARQCWNDTSVRVGLESPRTPSVRLVRVLLEKSSSKGYD